MKNPVHNDYLKELSLAVISRYMYISHETHIGFIHCKGVVQVSKLYKIVQPCYIVNINV